MLARYRDTESAVHSLELDKVVLVSTPAGYPELRLLSPQPFAKDSDTLYHFATPAEHGIIVFDNPRSISPYNPIYNLQNFNSLLLL